MSTPKKLGIIALLVLLIMFVINRVRNEVIIGFDSDE